MRFNTPAKLLGLLALLGAAAPAVAAEITVSAIAEDTIASPGNRQPLYIIIAANLADGRPVTTLTAANVAVDPIIVGPGGALFDVVSFNANGRLPGTYIMQVVPIRTETWKAGTYVIGVNIVRGTDKGQTLTSVLMD